MCVCSASYAKEMVFVLLKNKEDEVVGFRFWGKKDASQEVANQLFMTIGNHEYNEFTCNEFSDNGYCQIKSYHLLNLFQHLFCID